MNIFQEEIEQIAIERIQKFAKIADKMKFEICVGFSGGKDSQVVYDLCKRSGIQFKAYYNHTFESPVTLRFIRENYPEVIWRRDYKYGFIENIKVHGMLPTVQKAFCCDNYKHNPKYVDKCSVVGVRRQESSKRATRTTISFKNKTTKKKMGFEVGEYFKENCQSIGTASVIQLLPIVDWSSDDVWNYIHKYDLPINPEYEHSKRVGCIVCPKANFTSNFIYLMKYPKLVDCFIKARERGGAIDWVITSEKKDFQYDKVYYICRWLNHSFMPFTNKQQALYEQFRQRYDRIKNNNQTDNNRH